MKVVWRTVAVASDMSYWSLRAFFYMPYVVFLSSAANRIKALYLT